MTFNSTMALDSCRKITFSDTVAAVYKKPNMWIFLSSQAQHLPIEPGFRFSFSVFGLVETLLRLVQLVFTSGQVTVILSITRARSATQSILRSPSEFQDIQGCPASAEYAMATI